MQWFQKISILTPWNNTELPRARGSKRGKYLKEKGYTKTFLSRGFEMQSN